MTRRKNKKLLHHEYKKTIYQANNDFSRNPIFRFIFSPNEKDMNINVISFGGRMVFHVVGVSI